MDDFEIMTITLNVYPRKYRTPDESVRVLADMAQGRVQVLQASGLTPRVEEFDTVDGRFTITVE